MIKNQKQLVGYAGLDVRIKQSGNSSSKGSISKKGNVHLRHALYMPALSASRHNPRMKHFYEQLKTRQTAKKQGIVAISKKLLLLIYAIWKNKSEYSPLENVPENLTFITV